MRRKIKTLSTRVTLRKSAMSAAAATRRAFPAWIDANEHVVTFAATVTPRVRDGLVLRAVAKRKTGGPTNSSDASRAR